MKVVLGRGVRWWSEMKVVVVGGVGVDVEDAGGGGRSCRVEVGGGRCGGGG